MGGSVCWDQIGKAGRSLTTVPTRRYSNSCGRGLSSEFFPENSSTFALDQNRFRYGSGHLVDARVNMLPWPVCRLSVRRTEIFFQGLCLGLVQSTGGPVEQRRGDPVRRTGRLKRTSARLFASGASPQRSLSTCAAFPVFLDEKTLDSFVPLYSNECMKWLIESIPDAWRDPDGFEHTV